MSQPQQRKSPYELARVKQEQLDDPYWSQSILLTAALTACYSKKMPILLRAGGYINAVTSPHLKRYAELVRCSVLLHLGRDSHARECFEFLNSSLHGRFPFSDSMSFRLGKLINDVVDARHKRELRNSLLETLDRLIVRGWIFYPPVDPLLTAMIDWKACLITRQTDNVPIIFRRS